MIHRMDPPDDPERRPIPEGSRPMLATPADQVPKRRGEVVLRGQVGRDPCPGHDLRRSDAIEVRSGRDVSARYPELRELGRSMGTVQVVLDGEIVALDPATGRPSFERSNGGCTWSRRAPSAGSARTCRSSTPSSTSSGWTGHPLKGLPYDERRRALEGLGLRPAWHRRSPAWHEGDGTLLTDAVRRPGGRRGQAARLRLRAGDAHPPLAEGQEPPVPGVRRRRLPAGGRIPRPIRCAPPRRVHDDENSPAAPSPRSVRRPGRHGLHRDRVGAADATPRSAPAPDTPPFDLPSPRRAQRGPWVGARDRRRGGLHRVDGRRASCATRPIKGLRDDKPASEVVREA